MKRFPQRVLSENQFNANNLHLRRLINPQIDRPRNLFIVAQFGAQERVELGSTHARGVESDLGDDVFHLGQLQSTQDFGAQFCYGFLRCACWNHRAEPDRGIEARKADFTGAEG